MEFLTKYLSCNSAYMYFPAVRADPKTIACSLVEASLIGICKTFRSSSNKHSKMSLKFGREAGRGCLHKLKRTHTDQRTFLSMIVVVTSPAVDHDLIDHSGAAGWRGETVA